VELSFKMTGRRLEDWKIGECFPELRALKSHFSIFCSGVEQRLQGTATPDGTVVDLVRPCSCHLRELNRAETVLLFGRWMQVGAILVAFQPIDEN
jgi:hypothetical protein